MASIKLKKSKKYNNKEKHPIKNSSVLILVHHIYNKKREFFSSSSLSLNLSKSDKNISYNERRNKLTTYNRIVQVVQRQRLKQIKDIDN